MTDAYLNKTQQYRSRAKFADPDEVRDRAILVSIARNRFWALGTSNIPAFTDNSTGTAGSLFKAEAVARAALDSTANATAASGVIVTRGTGGSYVPGDLLTLGGDTGTEPVLPITETEVRTVAVGTSGTGADATGVLFTGTTGTGDKVTFTGDISTNTLSNLALVSRGRYTTNPTLTNMPVTATGYTGYAVTVTMGAKTLGVPTVPGSVSVIAAEPHATTTNSATGTGATVRVTWNAGVSKANFDAAVTAANNALSVCAKTLGVWGALLGIPTPVYGGTVAADNTIPAMTKSFAGNSAASGSTSIDYTTGTAAMVRLRNSMASVIRMLNMLHAALGEVVYTDPTGGSPSSSAIPNATPPYGGTNQPADPSAALVLTNPATTTQGTGATAGATSISMAILNPFFSNMADNVATVASAMNALRTALTSGTGRPVVVVAVD